MRAMRWFGALLALALGGSPAVADQILDLADIINGGNGTGTGVAGTGLNARTGAVVGTFSGAAIGVPGPNVYSPVAHAYIDGITVPDGGLGLVTVSTTGLTTTLPNTSGNTWNHLLGNTVNDVASGFPGMSIGTFGGPINFVTDPGRSVINAHANKLVTFDLDAIRAATGDDVTQFDTLVGVHAGGSASDYAVLLDGVVVSSGATLAPNSLIQLSIPISGERFLSLFSGDQNSFSADQVGWGDPFLTLVTPPPPLVPEPSAVALFGMAAAGLALVHWRRRR